MKYNTVLARIQNLTGLTPSQAELCKITGIKQNTMSNRANRDSDFTVGEIDLLNSYYGINIITNELNVQALSAIILNRNIRFNFVNYIFKLNFMFLHVMYKYL